jgi:uncharacterized protein (DUF362 family)
MPNSYVALVRGENRYDNVSRALAQLTADVDFSGKQQVLVKPNFVVTHNPLAATHIDAVRAVLDFVRARYDGPLTIAEGPALVPAAEGFRRYGYDELANTYNAALLDLNHDEPVPVDVYDWRLRPLRLGLARSVVESDVRISVGPPKTHDVVMITLGLKNMIMGSLISRFTHDEHAGNGRKLDFGKATKALWRMVPMWVRRLPPAEWLTFRVMSHLEPSDKMKMHQSYPIINLNLALIAPLVAPHLSVIDAFEAMEGNGPTDGTPVPLHLALASTDALATDVVGAALMGFDADDVGYLHYCKEMGLGIGDLDQIEIVGNTSLAECALKFRPHDTYARQRCWRKPGLERHLAYEEVKGEYSLHHPPGPSNGPGPHHRIDTSPTRSPRGAQP